MKMGTIVYFLKLSCNLLFQAYFINHTLKNMKLLSYKSYSKWYTGKRICLLRQEMQRDPVLIPGSRRSPGVGNRNPLQYSCLENSMDRGSW